VSPSCASVGFRIVNSACGPGALIGLPAAALDANRSARVLSSRKTCCSVLPLCSSGFHIALARVASRAMFGALACQDPFTCWSTRLLSPLTSMVPYCVRYVVPAATPLRKPSYSASLFVCPACKVWEPSVKTCPFAEYTTYPDPDGCAAAPRAQAPFPGVAPSKYTCTKSCSWSVRGINVVSILAWLWGVVCC
jgi:hypothetical protein